MELWQKTLDKESNEHNILEDILCFGDKTDAFKYRLLYGAYIQHLGLSTSYVLYKRF
jgi:hypothetical protein